MKIKNAFTLAETLITVVILGIVSTILVPNLIKNQVENANRTKVKKAMAAYEKAINIMIIENDIKSTEALRELGQDNCQYTREYFKTVQDGTNNCIFKTSDGVWWNITDITNPFIILKKSLKDEPVETLITLAKNVNDNTVFALVSIFDDIGTLRVNDNAYEQSNGTADQRKYVGKLWYFITQSSSVLTGFDKCIAEGLNTCKIQVNGINTTYTRIITNTDTTVGTYANGNSLRCIYNRDTNTKNCNGFTSTVPKGEYWISNNLGLISEEEAKDITDSVCTNQNCIDSGDYYEAAKRKCENSGGHLPNLSELKIAQSNGKLSQVGYYWSSDEYDPNAAYRLHSNGLVYDANKFITSVRVICIGNN